MPGEQPLGPAHATAAVTGATDVDVVLSQIEVPSGDHLAAFEAATEAGPRDDPRPRTRRTPIDGLLDLSTQVIVNETEFADLFTGSPAEGEAPRDDDLLAAASTMKGRLVVTLGAARCMVVEGSQVQRVPAPACAPGR